MAYQIHTGDSAAVLPTLPAASFDLVLTDPPYPCIKRSYGTWTEAEWWALMRAVVPECMRVLKPTGSAVFILQPNSERVGRMRTWLWEFMAWVGKEWGIVQDAWWWNHETLPSRGATHHGLCRPSVKACVWVGSEDCYRLQEAVLWEESERNKAMRLGSRAVRGSPSGWTVDNRRMGDAALKRGGVTPFNLLPMGGCNRWDDGGGAHGHGASTPSALCSWWTRYLCPPGGRVLDPFAGTSTVGLAALAHGADFTGIERILEYVKTSRRRLAGAETEAQNAAPLFAGL